MGIVIKSENCCMEVKLIVYAALKTQIQQLAQQYFIEACEETGIKPNSNPECIVELFKKMQEMDEQYDGMLSDTSDFLRASGSETDMDVKHCKSLLKLINNEDSLLCQLIAQNPTMSEFLKIIEDGIDSGKGFTCR